MIGQRAAPTPYEVGKIHCGRCGEFDTANSCYMKGGRVYHYCGTRVSFRTESGSLKVKPTRDARPR